MHKTKIVWEFLKRFFCFCGRQIKSRVRIRSLIRPEIDSTVLLCAQYPTARLRILQKDLPFASAKGLPAWIVWIPFIYGADCDAKRFGQLFLCHPAFFRRSRIFLKASIP
jgi:hypothetical protein